MSAWCADLYFDLNCTGLGCISHGYNAHPLFLSDGNASPLIKLLMMVYAVHICSILSAVATAASLHWIDRYLFLLFITQSSCHDNNRHDNQPPHLSLW